MAVKRLASVSFLFLRHASIWYGLISFDFLPVLCLFAFLCFKLIRLSHIDKDNWYMSETISDMAGRRLGKYWVASERIAEPKWKIKIGVASNGRQKKQCSADYLSVGVIEYMHASCRCQWAQRARDELETFLLIWDLSIQFTLISTSSRSIDKIP